MHTTLKLRKVKPPLPIRQLVVGGVAVAVLLSILGVGEALEGNDSNREAAVQSTPPSVASLTSKPTKKATPELRDETTLEPTGQAPAPRQPAEVPDGPLTNTTVDALLDTLNAGGSGGIKVGDRFRITGELFEDDAGGVGATGEYSVYLMAKGGRDDLFVFVDRTLTTGWCNGTRVEMLVKAVEKTINGETTGGWLQAQSAREL